MWLWILAVLLLGLIWGGGFLLSSLGTETPILLRIGLSAAVVMIVAGVLLYRRWKAGAAARALEREILKQTEQQAELAGPDRRAEIIQLKAQVERGIQALKQSRLGERGQNALYALPWFMIVGPPGVGKTTALRYSGLDFPLLGATGGGVTGVGGTRNCDWWFSNDAILLDTAGRYATHTEDQPEWFAFLDLLRRFRKKRPINGVILAVSVVELVEQNDEQRGQMARLLRARIDELQSRLDMVVPVYVMFTKLDLVAGFSEYFNDLKRSERENIFGATFPLDLSKKRKADDLFQEEFSLLSSQIHSRTLQRVARERSDQRARVLQFPMELAVLRGGLADFLGCVFEQRDNKESPIFRGFYFTSGTQEGSPVDRVLGGLVRAFGISTQLAPPARTEPKSYFVTDVFRRVVFPDKNIAARTVRELRREWFSRLALVVLAGLFGLIISVSSVYAFRTNQMHIAKGKQAVKSAQDLAHSQPVPGLDPLQKEAQQLGSWRQERPIRAGAGMYVGNLLYPTLRDRFVQEFEGRTKDFVEIGLNAAIHGQLPRVPSPTASAEEKQRYHTQYQRKYNALKLHLMLARPDRLNVDWATKQLMLEFEERGSKVYGLEGDGSSSKVEEAKSALAAQTRYYLGLIKDGEAEPWEEDHGLVARGRSSLGTDSARQNNYAALISALHQKYQLEPITHTSIFGRSSAVSYIGAKRGVYVKGEYTRPGWIAMRELLGARGEDKDIEAWVLGESLVQGANDELVAALQNQYFENYKRAWGDFIADINVHEPENAEVSLKVLTALSEREWPYKRFIQVVNENMVLEVGGPELSPLERQALSLGKKAIGKLTNTQEQEAEKPPRLKSSAELAFAPLLDFGVPPEGTPPEQGDQNTQLAQYQAILSKLIGVLSDLKDGDTAPDPMAVAKEFEDAFRATSALLASQSGFTRPLLSPLLMNPIRHAWAGVVSDAGGAATAMWETNVWSVWRSTLFNRYPFKKTEQDASLADFQQFFNPKSGLLWAFYEENLKGSLKRNGPSFIPARRFASSMGYSQDFIGKCLTRGAEISSALFPGAGEEVKVEFEVNLHSVSEEVSEVAIEIDGVAYVYKNHPEQWLAAVWPAPDGKTRGARVRVKGYRGLDEEISRPGDFGIYRLIDAAHRVEPGTAGGVSHGVPTVVATWRLHSRDAYIKLDFKPSKRDRALSPRLFLDYDCPRVIAR